MRDLREWDRCEFHSQRLSDTLSEEELASIYADAEVAEEALKEELLQEEAECKRAAMHFLTQPKGTTRGLE